MASKFNAMKDIDPKIVAEMSLARFVQKTNGLRVTEMHLRVLTLLEQTDRFTMLSLMDKMVDELMRNGVRPLGPKVQSLNKKQILLLLIDLRRWFIITYCDNAVECCEKVCELLRQNEELERNYAALKARLNDGWTDRVTYENVVEQIAACEDASERDDARKLFEPMLKRDMARKFREDIKKKVKEMNPEDVDNALIKIESAEVKVESPGNNIAHTIIKKN